MRLLMMIMFFSSHHLIILLLLLLLFYILSGENASLGCTVTSIPGSQVKWKSGERVIQNMSLMSFGRQFYIIKEGNFGQFERTSTLYIVNVLEKDAGR